MEREEERNFLSEEVYKEFFDLAVDIDFIWPFVNPEDLENYREFYLELIAPEKDDQFYGKFFNFLERKDRFRLIKNSLSSDQIKKFERVLGELKNAQTSSVSEILDEGLFSEPNPAKYETPGRKDRRELGFAVAKNFEEIKKNFSLIPDELIDRVLPPFRNKKEIVIGINFLSKFQKEKIETKIQILEELEGLMQKRAEKDWFSKDKKKFIARICDECSQFAKYYLNERQTYKDEIEKQEVESDSERIVNNLGEMKLEGYGSEKSGKGAEINKSEEKFYQPKKIKERIKETTINLKKAFESNSRFIEDKESSENDYKTISSKNGNSDKSSFLGSDLQIEIPPVQELQEIMALEDRKSSGLLGSDIEIKTPEEFKKFSKTEKKTKETTLNIEKLKKPSQFQK